MTDDYADPGDLEPMPDYPEDVPSWLPVDLSTYLDGSHKPVVPTLLARTDGVCLLYPGLIHSLHGESESGKSLVAQYLAAQQIMAGNDVLFIDFESDAGTVTERLLMLGATPQAIRDHFTYIRPEVDPRALAELPAWHAMLSGSYVLAVIDGVTDSLGVFEYSTKDNDEVAAWMRVLPKNIANRTGAAVAVIDHTDVMPALAQASADRHLAEHQRADSVS
jgi:AAA domain